MMDISKLNGVLEKIQEIGSRENLGSVGGAKKEKGQFENIVSSTLHQVNNDLVSSDKISQEFMTEGKHDLHEVIIALEKADLSFRYMTQVRNKVLDAYSEVMRTQV